MSTTPKNMKPLDDISHTGQAVADAVRSHRQRLGLSYASLEQRLDEIGYRIPLLGLRRIEAGARRVDVDDLMALSVALEVSPIELLAHWQEHVNHPDTEQMTTALPANFGYGETRAWIRGDLRLTPKDRLRFARREAQVLDLNRRQNQEELEALRAEVRADPNQRDLRDRISAFEHCQVLVEYDLAMNEERIESLEREVSDVQAER